MSRRRVAEVRYPMHEIEARLGWPTISWLADELGVTVAAVGKWRERGLSHRQADELAVRLLNLPAVLIWPEWVDRPMQERTAAPPRAERPESVWHESRMSVGDEGRRKSRHRRRGHSGPVDACEWCEA